MGMAALEQPSPSLCTSGLLPPGDPGGHPPIDPLQEVGPPLPLGVIGPVGACVLPAPTLDDAVVGPPDLAAVRAVGVGLALVLDDAAVLMVVAGVGSRGDRQREKHSDEGESEELLHETLRFSGEKAQSRPTVHSGYHITYNMSIGI